MDILGPWEAGREGIVGHRGFLVTTLVKPAKVEEVVSIVPGLYKVATTTTITCILFFFSFITIIEY